VLSVPDGDALEDAFAELDLLVSLDFYVNETNRHADYILPAPTWLERADVPLAFLGFYTTPFIQHTEAVVPPAGEAREEWEVIEALAKAVGVVPSAIPALRRLGRIGIRPGPERLLDLLLRTGPARLSLSKLRRHPHGMVLGEHPATGVLREKVRHRGKRVRLDTPEIRGELARLRTLPPENGDLRLIGMRELRSHNSWMHNAPLLMRGGRTHALRIHPDDAAASGLSDGALARVTSKSGSVEVPVKVTDEMRPGTVALPHGWGHRGGWRLANAHAGVNVNRLASGDPADLEPLAGMAHLNGIPVSVEPLGQRDLGAGADAESQRGGQPEVAADRGVRA
jgi:formate dehydrogenase